MTHTGHYTNKNNGAIIAQDEDVKSRLVINVSPQRPQGMNCVHYFCGHLYTMVIRY